MNNKLESDKMKDLFGKSSSAPRSDQDSLRNIQKIMSRVQRQENVTHLMNFGLIRFWTVLLSFFAFMYAKNNSFNKFSKTPLSLKKQET